MATALIVGLAGWVLIAALAGIHRGPIATALQSVTLVPLTPPPPERVVPERKPSRAPEGEAAPPNVRSTPTQVVAPEPPVVLLPPPPIAVATVAGPGAETSAGAAEVPGPGTGAGGIGNGRGSGGSGDGTGGGLREAPPRRIRGELEFSDAAKIAGDGMAMLGRTMTTRFLVEVDGRVTGCRVIRSSGLPAVDAEMCRLIERRFRYRPARDEDGFPVRSGVQMDHGWDQNF